MRLAPEKEECLSCAGQTGKGLGSQQLLVQLRKQAGVIARHILLCDLQQQVCLGQGFIGSILEYATDISFRRTSIGEVIVTTDISCMGVQRMR